MTMPDNQKRYHPPRSISVPWRVVVLKEDPDYEREVRNHMEFEMSNGRKFYGNPAKRGPYAED